MPILLAAATPTATGAQTIVARPASDKNAEFIADHYPPGALKRGEQGRVEFRIIVEPDGSLGSCEVTASSGFKGLDEETCEIIVRHARLKPIRNAEGRTVRATQIGYMNWRLPAGAATAVAAAPKRPASLDNPDRIICKRSPKIGSMIIKVRQCLTQREWDLQARNWRDELDRLIGKGYTSGTGD